MSMSVIMLGQALLVGRSLTLLVGGSRGLAFLGRRGLGSTRVPWSDIDRVVFSNGQQPNTIELGVALRPEAKPRRSSFRYHDVLLDLPCRVVLPRASFDFAALQRLLAAHPGGAGGAVRGDGAGVGGRAGSGAPLTGMGRRRRYPRNRAW